MKHPAPPKRQRCAIYTRKSTEHNLDLAFNSLDAQRESCEAYVKSQAHEGWSLLADRYDDGGLSGASLQRPALQRLLSDIRSGRVDVIVVYKVDRLTRSLADFAKLVEEFDAHGVAFVSVTQSFNTTSSMGRLTLNVLLSFAQFEREVIGERVRDKIAASKRKGIWVGGPVPLGYRSVGKVLVVVPEEAETVRTIFTRYLIAGSIRLLIDDLHQLGICPRGRLNGDGSRAQATADRFMVGPLAHILKNRFYIGQVFYKGEVHAGQHEPIVDGAVFEAVQQRLRAAAVTHRAGRRSSSFLLAGRLYDDRGHRMTPSHANKRGVRYRYYVSQAVLQNRMQETGTISRVSAPDIELLVVSAVRRYVDDAVVHQGSTTSAIQPSTVTKDGADHEVVAAHVERVVVGAQQLEITLRGVQDPEGRLPEDGSPPSILTVPWQPRAASARKGITHAPSGAQHLDPHTREVLLAAIGRAKGWVRDLTEGRVTSFEEIACQEGKAERHIRLLASLAFVSPAIIGAIIDGHGPAGLTVTGMARTLPHTWSEQARQLGIA